jgi:RluA family pseudouridine synthase
MDSADVFDIPVPPGAIGRTLRAFLGDALPLEPEIVVTNLILNKHATINGEASDPRRVLRADDLISVRKIEAERNNPNVRTIPADVIYEDDYLLVVNKPAGCMVVRPRHSEICPFQHGILDYLRKSEEKRKAFQESRYRPRPVHRLDRDTSGAVIISKTAEAERHLFMQFQERRVKKEYLAVVTGELAEASSRIDARIAAHPDDLARMLIEERHGKPSETEVEVIERFRGFTLVMARPLTGRRHQIRIHLAHIGYPVLADVTYGGGSDLMLSSIKRGYRPKPDQPEKPLISHPALHAAAIGFRPVGSNTLIRIEAPLPSDMALVLKSLRKYAGR